MHRIANKHPFQEIDSCAVSDQFGSPPFHYGTANTSIVQYSGAAL
jgi:hypothetical protein